ncbi:MAG TPA: LLM class flavin-dependent oxidoreductase [Actinomycetota bacterium]|jgi:alkanesulfonate monooxygenase SsuD/methylene tetrahydromethanopterin reductase-like flavin-dependent oxidoreductase (luciferase family)|nr:LLM class flavin-dependent oxidoreductase [Actinomycetota bacterium]
MTTRIEFGISITPNWQENDEVLRLAQVADEAGLDLVGIQDHPYQWRFLDTWTLISYLAAKTSRIRFFPDVTNLPLRPPAVLAKSAASLDVLTGGRLELGLGAGGFWDAIEAMGGPRRTPGQAVEATEEAIDVIRLVWSGERGVRYEGRHYQLSGLRTGPKPAHDIGIWLGASGPRMLDLIGRKADGWVPSAPWAPPEELPGYLARIEDAATRAGRDPRSIRRVYNLMGAIGPATGERFVGPISYWVDELVRLVELGMDAFIFWPAGEDREHQVEVFAAEVAPAVRAGAGAVTRSP